MTTDFFKYKYGYEIEGIWLPRVTAITSLISRSFSFAGAGAAADWGTKVHAAVERIMKNEYAGGFEDIAPSVRAFEKWRTDHGVKPAGRANAVEARVWDFEHGYAGTLDLVAEVQGRVGVVDVKTASVMREEYALQTAAYMGAYNLGAPGKEKAETRWILRIDQYRECRGCMARKKDKDKKGRAQGGNEQCNHQWGEAVGAAEFLEFPDFLQDFNAFLAAKEVWEWYHRGILRGISNYPKNVVQKVLV
ncbi:MAG: hypothetical protein HY482_01185 [Candidatus Wildermuthbacteria bacterium]|nr:hypothetical protein [Candidatus Wildermuthbacteria bacterium]